MSERLPTHDDVLSAAARISGLAHRTPVATSHTLDAMLGARLFLKCENLQRIGAFKFRGAYNAISRLSAEQRSRGIVAFSSGNHAQAVALASRLLETRATVVMPTTAPASKRRATEGYGARVIAYDPEREDRAAIASALEQAEGLALVPPYDNADVIAGQGTAALELMAEAGPLDVLLVPCGGGGLLSGSCLAVQGSSCRVIGVEPEAGDDAARSFRSGALETVKNPQTIADGARTPSLGKLTFPLVRALAADVVTVSDVEIVAAMRFLWERMKLVVEPTGALGLAAAMAGRVDIAGARVGVVLSGGNVDLDAALRLFSDPPAA